MPLRIGLALGLLLVFGPAGCALRIEPVALGPHLVLGSRTEREAGPRLGVARFWDARPAWARQEVHPPLRWEGIALARRGDVRTGDESFVGTIADGLRRDVVATLRGSEAFTRVDALDVDGKDLPGRWPSPDLDLVLTAKIEEFGAVQYQEAALHPWRVGWLRRRLEDPVGFARLHVRVHEPTGRSWTYRVDVERTVEGASITLAALDAMAYASESLARQLYADWSGTREEELRVLPLRVRDACGLSPARMRELMEDVSEVFEREAGVRLHVHHERWRGPPERLPLSEVLGTVEQHGGASEGIVLALIPRRHVRVAIFSREHFGLARSLGQYAVVRCGAEGQLSRVTVIHELAHLFGAVHMRARRSIMNPFSAFDGRFFDPLNRRILRLTRERAFGAPLETGTARRLRSIYATAARFPSCCDARELEHVLSLVDPLAGSH
ncbi:MAG: hypothetical protein ACE5FG_05175 [Myxococcota bacterium]